MSRYNIVHSNEFKYGGPVRASYNETRMMPTGRGQKLLDFELTITPMSSRYDYTDYWGSRVTAFEVLRPHESLSIVARSHVEVVAPEPHAPDREVDWEVLADSALRDRMSVYLTHTETTAVPAEILDLAQGLAATHRPEAAAKQICDEIREAMEYVPGVTSVHTPAVDAWAVRKGVCQDIAHLTVGALRAVGIPALYVSGYYDPRPAEELDEATVIGQSHAWIEWWAGSWQPYDPTNRIEVADQHVVVGRGREYNDVPPFKGVFAGGCTSDLEVSVAMTRTA